LFNLIPFISGYPDDIALFAFGTFLNFRRCEMSGRRGAFLFELRIVPLGIETKSDEKDCHCQWDSRGSIILANFAFSLTPTQAEFRSFHEGSIEADPKSRDIGSDLSVPGFQNRKE